MGLLLINEERTTKIQLIKRFLQGQDGNGMIGVSLTLYRKKKHKNYKKVLGPWFEK